jgi:Protein of unknown function (DUF3788)
MSEMAPNAFIGKTTEPSDGDIEKALGRAKPVWDGLIAELEAQYGVSTREWNSYSVKAGWSLRLKRGKRTIVWLGPCVGCFRAAFILGDKALAAARQSGLSARVVKALDEAPKYPEGTGVRLEVRGPRDVPTVKKLVVAKLEN